MALGGLNSEAPRPDQGAPSQGSGGIMALLSLKLLLLAFFILLTALATIEQKRLSTVVRSVNEAFEGRVKIVSPQVASQTGEWRAQPNASVLSRLSRLFHANFPMARIDVDSEQGEMRMELDASVLFPAGSTQPGGRAQQLLNSLYQALETRGGEGYEIEFFHSYPPGESRRLARSEGADEVFLRPAALVEDMSRKGVADRHLSVGLFGDQQEKVRLVLRVWGGPGEPQTPRRTWR